MAKNFSDYSVEEQTLLLAFRTLDAEGKETFTTMLKVMAGEAKAPAGFLVQLKRICPDIEEIESFEYLKQAIQQS